MMALTLVAAWVLAVAAPGDAQTLTTIACTDAAGRPVQSVQKTNGVIARAAIDADKRRVIESDSRKVEGVSAQQQLFVYAHECAHHALGHDVDQPFTGAQEHDADCQAIQTLIRRAGLTSNDVMLLQADMRELAPDSARRLPWRSRTYDLESCLPEVAAQRQAASRSGEVSATDCIVHNDAQNAIVNASRDRLTIDGVYAVSNRCARSVTCTFSIEIGTLPDSDADAGSWRNFRVQATVTDQHALAASASATEYRFRGRVDSVAIGESVDFRVVPACR
jgi:hypothetical protein